MAAADRSQVCRRPGIFVVVVVVVVLVVVCCCCGCCCCRSCCRSSYCCYCCRLWAWVCTYVNIALHVCSNSSFNQTVHLARELLNTTIPVCLHMEKRYLYIPSMFYCALQTFWRCIDSSYAWVNCFSINQLVGQDIILKIRTETLAKRKFSAIVFNLKIVFFRY